MLDVRFGRVNDVCMTGIDSNATQVAYFPRRIRLGHRDVNGVRVHVQPNMKRARPPHGLPPLGCPHHANLVALRAAARNPR